MLVTRVEVEAPITSFRYPHFLVGRQPTYEMPPPATLYGHLCSAVGEWVAADDLALGLRFTYAAKADDLEHQTIVRRSSGSLDKPSRTEQELFRQWKSEHTVEPATDGKITPTRREFLFDVRLTFYVTGDWSQAFRSPRYAVVLGRSQDLASYRSVTLLKLQRAPEAYYEHTLLPWSLRPAVVRARAETMARWIDYARGRQAQFDRFLIVKERVRTTAAGEWLRLPDAPEEHWVDPDSPAVEGLRRGVWLHRLRDASP